MKLAKYISKKNIARLIFFAVVVGVAGLFDMYYEGDFFSFPEDTQEQPDTKNVDLGGTYFYNPTQTSNLITAAQKLTSKKLFGRTLSRFIQQHHHTRAFQLLKTKSLEIAYPIRLLTHFFIFQRHYYSSPDDDILIA